ncbi:hypothetical protein HOB87_02390 [Candidatus Woesearchaeota archaeon]|jgi:hypothetical protein|nr:hypothetical protein [bacterium]MBT4730806.1 hypothetical protein [Candidatus Woesearchaeota archaeon]
MRELERPLEMPVSEFQKCEFPKLKNNLVLCEALDSNQKFLTKVSRSERGFIVKDILGDRACEITCTTFIPKTVFDTWQEIKEYFEKMIEKNPQSAWSDIYQKYIAEAITHI